MLKRARRLIRRVDFNQRHLPKSCLNQQLTIRTVREISRASVIKRLDFIRIRLLRSQLEELYKIKNLLEDRLIKQHEQEQEQRAQHKLEQEKRRKEIEEHEENARQRLAELERMRSLHIEQREDTNRVECSQSDDNVIKEEKTQHQYVTKSDADTTQMNTTVNQQEEHTTPPVHYYTPEEEKNKKELRCSTIQEEDDLVPSIKSTPPRSYPRQSIGQWSVERAKNNMSVRSMISSLEVKVGPKGGPRARTQK